MELIINDIEMAKELINFLTGKADVPFKLEYNNRRTRFEFPTWTDQERALRWCEKKGIGIQLKTYSFKFVGV